ncbi:MAG: zf-HC2 domain-containing protein [Pseudomonadota bacterium]
MSELSETDWELINAYHDGELDTAERQALEARLHLEPVLEQALKDVMGVSASLSALRPGVQETSPPQPAKAANLNRRPPRWVLAGALTTAIALAVVLGPQFFEEPSVFDIHAEFSASALSVEMDDLRAVAAENNVDVPDLLGANLTPVGLRRFESGSVAHYAGRNGCRLSYFRGAVELDNPASAGAHQVAVWTTAGTVRHMIIATSMDQDKFDAIAEYLKFVTRQQGTDQMVASLAHITAHSERCLS